MGATALFLVLAGGTAYAVDGPNPGQNTIGSEDIIGNEVKSDDIGNGRIFNLDVADEILTGSKLKNGTVTGADIDESQFDATIRTPGMMRSGSESGTSEAPVIGDGAYDGLVIRRINSRSVTAGQVIARTNGVELWRDGTRAGLTVFLRYNTGTQSIACTGQTDDGRVITHDDTVSTNDGGVFFELFDNEEEVIKVDCQFGNVYSARHWTSVEMLRASDDNYWVGSLTSTYNQ